MNRTPQPRAGAIALVALVSLLAGSLSYEAAIAATQGQDAVAYLQNQFGINERQAQGALGALLVYAREQLPKPQFDELASRMPNADLLMQAVQAQGVVTRPMSDIDDYRKSLGNLRISQQQAAQIAPAVVQFLGNAGFNEEQAILQGILR